MTSTPGTPRTTTCSPTATSRTSTAAASCPHRRGPRSTSTPTSSWRPPICTACWMRAGEGEGRLRPCQQVEVVDGDGQGAGGSLRQPTSRVGAGHLAELGPLLAGRGQPAGEPLRGEGGAVGAEAPGAGTYHDVVAEAAEGVDRRASRVRTEQASRARDAPLAGVERVHDVSVEGGG